MPNALKRIGICLAVAVAGVLSHSTDGLARADKVIPPPPQYYVLDEPHLLNDQALRSLQALLVENDRASGEQVVVAIFNSLDGEDINDFTARVFQQWQIGQRGEDNGVLLAIYNQDHQARIEVGYGLEPQLTDAKSSRILHDILIPGMKAGQPAEGISQSVLQILSVTDSPLLQGGQAEKILHSGGMLRHDIRGNGGVPSTWWVWLVLGVILLSIVSNIMNSAEAHFTSAGWFRPRPWRRRWYDDTGMGGGGFGGGFGGMGGWSGGGGGDSGGFSGGGGRSGGGGASAGW